MNLILTKWAPLAGRWRFEGFTVTYIGPEDPSLPYGLTLSPLRLRSGIIKVKVSFNEIQESAGRIALGYNSATGAYFSVGIGGHREAYVLDEYIPGRGWKALRALGSNQNLSPQSLYEMETELRGQNVRLTVNTIKVLEEYLPYPPTGDQIGLFAWGTSEVKFEETIGEGAKPRAFVVMQFTEPYESLYSEVIKPVAAESLELDVYKADEEYKPGLILEDIARGIREAEVVIAEITPINANVFYEVGYAHALNKPTILLAERGSKIPFDLSGYRCIFYDNTIRGKTAVETSLKQHLKNILDGA